MHKSYEFVEKTDIHPFTADAQGVLRSHIATDASGWFSGNRSIEEQIYTLAENVGGLADLFISKGLITPDEFLKAIDADKIFKVQMTGVNVD